MLDSLDKTLIEMKLVPSCTLYFGWSFLDQTTSEHGPFLDMQRLRRSGTFVEKNFSTLDQDLDCSIITEEEE